MVCAVTQGSVGVNSDDVGVKSTLRDFLLALQKLTLSGFRCAVSSN